MTKNFIADESGAVTVDWVVLTASIVGIAIAVLLIIAGGINSASNNINGELSSTTSVASLVNGVVQQPTTNPFNLPQNTRDFTSTIDEGDHQHYTDEAGNEFSNYGNGNLTTGFGHDGEVVATVDEHGNITPTT